MSFFLFSRCNAMVSFELLSRKESRKSRSIPCLGLYLDPSTMKPGLVLRSWSRVHNHNRNHNLDRIFLSLMALSHSWMCFSLGTSCSVNLTDNGTERTCAPARKKRNLSLLLSWGLRCGALKTIEQCLCATALYFRCRHLFPESDQRTKRIITL